MVNSHAATIPMPEIQQFQLEPASNKLFEELSPLLVDHYAEVSSFPDLHLQPDFDHYHILQNGGVLRIFTRRRAGKLNGYAIFMVHNSIHYKHSLHAYHDSIYIDPQSRGDGMKFLRWCEQQLEAEGVKVVFQHVNTKFDFGKALERQGYEQIEKVYVKRLRRNHG